MNNQSNNQPQQQITLITQSAEETKQLANQLAQHLKPGDVILLKGDLGAGKTQFTQGLAAGLGVQDSVISPTFNILLEYHTGRIPLYHFDLYRLNSAEELEDIAFYETIEGDGVSVIEWWDKFPDCMPEEFLSVAIDIGEQMSDIAQSSQPASAIQPTSRSFKMHTQGMQHLANCLLELKNTHRSIR